MDFSKPAAPVSPIVAPLDQSRRHEMQGTRIAPGQTAQEPGTEARSNSGQGRSAAEARDLAALRREMERRALQPGPPPAFKLSLLEISRDLKHAIARAEAMRAVFPDLAPPQRQAPAPGTHAPSPAGHPGQVGQDPAE